VSEGNKMEQRIRNINLHRNLEVAITDEISKTWNEK